MMDEEGGGGAMDVDGDNDDNAPPPYVVQTCDWLKSIHSISYPILQYIINPSIKIHPSINLLINQLFISSSPIQENDRHTNATTLSGSYRVK